MRVLNVTLLLLIDIWKTKDLVGVLHSGPHIDITVYAAGSKVLIAMIGSHTQRNNLHNLVIMSFHQHIILITLIEAHDKEVAVAEGRNEEVALLAGNTHVLERLMRFIGITAALQLVVPDLHRHVVRACHELRLANLRQVRDVAFVGPLVFE